MRFLPPNGHWEDFLCNSKHNLYGPIREPHRTINKTNNNNNFTIKSYNITSYSLLTNLTNYNNLYSLYLLNLFL